MPIFWDRSRPLGVECNDLGNIFAKCLRLLFRRNLKPNFCNVRMQARSLLTKLTKRDMESGEGCPVFNELCLFGCDVNEEGIAELRKEFKTVHVHKKDLKHLPLESGTCVTGSSLI